MNIFNSVIASLVKKTINSARKKSLVGGMATVLAVSTLLVPSQASATLLLDTTLKGGDQGGSVPVFANFEWQEVAIPFSVTQAGRISKIETGLNYFRGTDHMVIGISNTNLLDTSGRPSSIWSTNICSANSPKDYGPYSECASKLFGRGQSWVDLGSQQDFAWEGDLYLGAGDYWLFASYGGDNFEGAWDTNNSLPTDNWATSSEAVWHAQSMSGTWAPVSKYGPIGGSGSQTGPEGAYGTPIARIFFQPVPEPTTLALFGLGLAGMALTRRRKH